MKKSLLYVPLFLMASLTTSPTFASNISSCQSNFVLQHVDLHFYEHDLGNFNINFSDTINAISKDQQSHNLAINQYPYYKKTWQGNCPGGLQGGAGSCWEFTVYPNPSNDPTDFTPDLEKAILPFTSGTPNRGMVRILTNHDETQYSYSTDHYTSFCGPYNFSYAK